MVNKNKGSKKTNSPKKNEKEITSQEHITEKKESLQDSGHG